MPVRAPWLLLLAPLFAAAATWPGVAHGNTVPREFLFTTASSYAYSSIRAAQGAPGLLYLGLAASVTGATTVMGGEMRMREEERRMDMQRMARAFLRHNRARLAVESARGGGESLETLGRLLGCPPSASAQLSRTARGAYGRLFPSQPLRPGAFLALLWREMTMELRASCRAGPPPPAAATPGGSP